jgi:monoamine oxidase
MSQTPNKIYDIILLGGGIAGIYTTYKLLQTNPNLSILLLESTERFGGRVFTTTKLNLEAGAGRFSSKHKHLLKLIKELGLEKKIKKAGSSVEYFPIRPQQSQHKLPSIFSSILEIYTGKPVNQLQELVATVIIASKLERKLYLQSVSFIEYATTILSKEEIQYIKDAFGYYSELVIMNAHDAIILMENLNPNNKFYILQGGLSQIIEEMIFQIKKKKPNQNILKRNQKVIKIIRNPNSNININTTPIYSIETESGNTYYTNKIIAALPKQALEKISFFKSLKSDFNKIICAPLCRIYSTFREKDKSWLQNLPKFTTNNNLRMVIPINPTTIMISYTDNKYAEYWHNLYKKEGIEKVEDKIAEYIKESTNITIPKPLETYIFYWSCGVGYWGIDADSQEISQKMVKPIQNEEVYICGEHYSERNQQWMEGALETSISVLQKIY